MTITEDILIDYVMGALSPEEEAQVSRYLQDNPQEAARIRDTFEAMGNLAMSLEPADIADDATDKLLTRIRANNTTTTQDAPNATTTKRNSSAPEGVQEVMRLPEREQPGWMMFAVAAVVALLAWFGFLAPRYESFRVTRQVNQACAVSANVCERIVSDTNEVIGTLVRQENNRILMVFHDDPPQDLAYQAWEIVDGTPRSLGVWEGRVLDVAVPLAENSAFGVTIEPEGGSEQPTSTPIVVYPL